MSWVISHAISAVKSETPQARTSTKHVFVRWAWRSVPFDQTSFEVKDGRKAALRNSGFGTVFAVADGSSAARVRLRRASRRSGSATGAAPASNSPSWPSKI